MTGFDLLGIDEIAKPLAQRAGEYGKVYGQGIRDGRGYGPYGAGYTSDGRPYGPNGEILSAKYDLQKGGLNRHRSGISWLPPKVVLPGFSADATVVGFSGMDFGKGIASALQSAGGMMSGGGSTSDKASDKGGDKSADAVKQALEKQRLEDDKRRAEESASKMKTILGVAAAIAAAGGIMYFARK